MMRREENGRESLTLTGGELPQVTISRASDTADPLLISSVFGILSEENDFLNRYQSNNQRLRIPRSWRSNSLTPPIGCQPPIQRLPLAVGTGKSRSMSLTFGQKDPWQSSKTVCFQQQQQQLSPRLGQAQHPSPSMMTCESDEKIEEMIRNLPGGSGMRGIKDWLKSLRLHKYTRILMEVSYEELLELTDEVLEHKGVTLGARGKILKNIGFMKQRPALLTELSASLEEISKTNDMEKLSRVLMDLEAIIFMPLKPYVEPPGSSIGRSSAATYGTEFENLALQSPDDVPGQIFNVLKKVFMIILLSECANHEVVTVYACLLNCCVKREAFSYVQKQKIASWLQKMKTLWNPPAIQKANDYRRRPTVRHDPGGRRLSGGTYGSQAVAAGSKLHPIPVEARTNLTQIKRHSYQEETKTVPFKNQDGVDEVRRSSFYEQAAHPPMPIGPQYCGTLNHGPIGGSWYPSATNLSSRRESSMSSDSGYMMSLTSGSRRPSDTEWGGGCKLTTSPLGYGLCSSSSTGDCHQFLFGGGSRRDSGLSCMTTDEPQHLLLQPDFPSRRSSALSMSAAAAATISENPIGPPVCRQTVAAAAVAAPLAAAASQQHLGTLLNLGSVSSGCASDGSTDSLLEQDLHQLSLSVTQRALD